MSDKKSKADVGTNASETLEGTDKADVMHGRGGTDTIKGGAGDDKLWGDAGSDRLYGGAGDDYLSGGSGSDRLVGGAGDDTLIGGSGYDTFVYDVQGGDQDVIKDFSGQDRITLAIPPGYNLSNMKVEQVGASTELDFGNGNTLTIQGQTPEQLGNLTGRFYNQNGQSLKKSMDDAFEDKADVGTESATDQPATEDAQLKEDTQPPDQETETPTEEEGDFGGETTSTGTLTLNEDGSGSWTSADNSQSASWDADGNGTYHSPEGDGTMSNVSYNSETEAVTFTDDMQATGTITSNGVLNLQFSGDGEDSEIDDIFSSAGLDNSDGNSEEQSTATDAAGEVLNELESEAAAMEAESDVVTDTSDNTTSTDQEPVDEGESDDEWPKVPLSEDS